MMKKMKSRLPILMMITMIATAGCAPKNDGEIPTFGQDTLSSDGRINGNLIETQGFDFSEGRIRYDVPGPMGTILDLIIQPMVGGSQSIGATLTMPGNIAAYYDMGPALLQDILEAPENGYLSEVILIQGFSYCILTYEQKFAKIYIIDLDYGQREDGSNYAWIRYDWVFQKDGGRAFGEVIGNP